MSLATLERERKKMFRKLCEQLTKNDPSVTVIQTLHYGTLDWEHSSQLATALEHNTHVSDMRLHLDLPRITQDGHIPLLYFLRTSASLRTVDLTAGGGDGGNEIHQHTSTSYHQQQDLGATNVLQAVSHNKNVVSLTINGVGFRRPDILETVLASTSQTLTKFEFNCKGDSASVIRAAAPAAVSEALRNGLERNSSLETATFTLRTGAHVSNVLFGLLLSLGSLRKLSLDFTADAVSVEALKFLLGGSETLETLWLTLSCSAPTLDPSFVTTILVGLASNRSIKKISLKGSVLRIMQFGLDSFADAKAWTRMLANNSTLEELDLSCHEGMFGSEFASAIARGLSKNVSVQKLNLRSALAPFALDGPIWRDALEKNSTLCDLGLAFCNIGSCFDFVAFAQGLSRSKSLKILDLSDNGLASVQFAVLGDALWSNCCCLESLNLTCNPSIVGPQGAGAVRSLWLLKKLLHLDLSHNSLHNAEDENAAFFVDGLPKNDTLQSIDFDGSDINSSDLCAIVNSLNGSRAIKELSFGDDCSCNVEKIYVLDGSAGTALKELVVSSSLETLDMCNTKVSRAGMAELAVGLRGKTSLRGLYLGLCDIDDEALVVLGEALVANSTLETLDIHGARFDAEDLRSFCGLLPRMKGLKKLHIPIIGVLDESLTEAIVEGVRRNKSLVSIFCLYNSELPADSLKSIEFYLKMNRNGRKYLQEDDKAKAKTENRDNSNNVRADMPHIGAWPRILAKMTSPSEQDQLFYFLRRKTDLFQGPFSDSQAQG